MRGSTIGQEAVSNMGNSYTEESGWYNYFGTVKSIEGMQLSGEAQK